MSDDKFSRTRAASDAASTEQTSARIAAMSAIEMMQSALALALDGHTIMGLPNLGRRGKQYIGLRITSRYNEALPLPTTGLDGPQDGREALCLNSKGEIEFASRGADYSLKVRKVRDEEFRAEWSALVAKAIMLAVDSHLGGADAAVERYANLRKLSERLSAALSEEE